MSRIIVKNLPKTTDEKDLRSRFSTQGIITDVKLMRTKDGRSRQFAFIGFKEENDANKCLAHFNNTYINTTKISVSLAVSIGSNDSAERPWSKYSKGSSAHAKKSDKTEAGGVVKTKSIEKITKLEDKKTDDSRFKTFTEVMAPRSKSKFWANDDLESQSLALVEERKRNKELVKRNSKVIREDEEEKVSMEESDEEEYQEIETVQQEISDMDYLKSKVKKNLTNEKMIIDDNEEEKGDEEEGVEEEDDEENDEEGQKKKREEDENKILFEKKGEKEEKLTKERKKINLEETGRLFIRNLSYTAQEEDIRKIFSFYGEISDINLPLDDYKRPKGFAFVQYLFPESAVNALAKLDGSVFLGRIMHVLPGEKGREEEEEGRKEKDEKEGGYKDKKEEERRKNANNQESWNALFVRSDTVLNALAKKMDVKKSDILDPTSGNMAVRLALGETQIISEVKNFLESEGVSLSALEKSIRDGKDIIRSENVFLIKNLPFATEVSELHTLFKNYGTIARLVLPPSRTIAIIEFLQSADAKKAFKGMAYKKFKHVPLYIEWAPHDIFANKAKGKTEKMNFLNNTGNKTKNVEEADAKKEEDEDEGDEGENMIENKKSIFIKNLNFTTTNEELTKKFGEFGGLRQVQISTKPDIKNKGGVLSMGFGFAEYKDNACALNAMKRLQGVEVDGHVLSLKFSTKALSKVKSNKRKRAEGDVDTGVVNGKKLMVRNLAFQATRQEVRELFGSFGQLKNVRLPKKFDGSHRGFGFVEFLTSEEAKIAFASLSSTHLYGRKLVCEWADENDDIETMREKSEKMAGSIEIDNKKAKNSKKVFEDDDDL